MCRLYEVRSSASVILPVYSIPGAGIAFKDTTVCIALYFKDTTVCIQIWVNLYGYNLRARLTVNSFNMPRDSASFKIPSSSTVLVPITLNVAPWPGFYWWQFNPVRLDIDILYFSLFAGFGFCASFLVMLQRPFVFSVGKLESSSRLTSGS